VTRPGSAPGGEVEVDHAHAEHRGRVDARIAAALGEGVSTWAELLGATEGADPRLVARRLDARGRSLPGRGPPGAVASSRWTPELHARDFEWYFAPACARALARRAAGLGRRVLCMGTPTVAFGLLERPAEAPPLERITLVDHNPLVDRRHAGRGPLEMLHHDLAAARPGAGRYDVAVFDAPWYPPQLRRWLALSAHAVRPGGTVLFALLPRLHRPSAPDDRDRLLAEARRLGDVRVEPGALAYESPRFEQEALAAAGLATPPAWRRADLVELCVRRAPAADGLAPLPAAPAWARFVVGAQVVHLDQHAPDEPGDVLAPIDERGDYRYASISTRDPRRERIGLWTSRSRVARVRRPALVGELLERLVEAGELGALDDAPPLRSMSDPERRRLLGALRTVLGPA